MVPILQAPRIIDGDRLRGVNKLSHHTLNSMIIRSTGADELSRNLAQLGHQYGYPTLSIVTCVQRQGNIVMINSSWLDGQTIGVIRVLDAAFQEIDLWATIGCALRAVILPSAEDMALVYISFVSVSLPTLTTMCGTQNTDLMSDDVPVGEALACEVPLIPMEDSQEPSGFGFLLRILWRDAGNLLHINRSDLLWEQCRTMKTLGFSRFLTFRDWNESFFPSTDNPATWPSTKMDHPVISRVRAASLRGRLLYF